MIFRVNFIVPATISARTEKGFKQAVNDTFTNLGFVARNFGDLTSYSITTHKPKVEPRHLRVK
jgi:hypothetical protein